MKYLFFDIECANCFDGKGKICEFAYIQTDNEFKILKEKSIKINPCSPFDKKGFAMRKIRFDMPYEEYNKLPDFKRFYSLIKSLLTQSNQIVIGHGTENDAHYLLDECGRYNLETIDFEFFDTCELAKLIYKRNTKLNLNNLHSEFCQKEKTTQNHRGLEDAYMTMELAQYYTENLKLPLHKIIMKYSKSGGESFKGRIIKAGQPDLHYSYINKLNDKNKKILNTFIKEETPAKPIKTFVLPQEYEENNFISLIIIINRLQQLNYSFSVDIIDNAIYVKNNSQNKKIQKYIEKNGEKPNTIEFNNFLSEIGLSEQDLNASKQELDEIIGNMKCNKKWYDEFKNTHNLFSTSNLG